MKELDHVLRKSPATPGSPYRGHPGAFADRKNESGNGPWR
jgi:hypothetical protein